MSIIQSIGLGALTGMRSMTPLAVLTDHVKESGSPNIDATPLQLLNSPVTATALKLMAVGEVMADKLPFMPARTALLPLAGRAVLGAVVGASVNPSERLRGAAAGAVAAMMSSYMAYHVRKTLHEQLRIPDPMIALVEDAIVVAAAQSLIRDQPVQVNTAQVR